MEILPTFPAENNLLHGIVAHILQSLMDGYQSFPEFCVHLEIYFGRTLWLSILLQQPYSLHYKLCLLAYPSIFIVTDISINIFV